MEKAKQGEPLPDPNIDLDADDFAPFSHDAQSGGTPTPPVPDGGATVLLLGAAMMSIAAIRRRIG